MSISVWREPVQDAWIDYNGHLSEAYYVLVLGHATDAVMDAIGLGQEYRSANDASLYTVEAHIRYLEEVSAGSDLEVRSSIIGVTGKLLWIWHELWVADRLRATEEVLGVHVRGGSSAPLPDDVAARAAQACLTPPPEAGRRIGPLRTA
jgi:acyl-CoA thioester hydrolase